MSVGVLAGRLVLAVALGVAGVAKLADRAGSREAVRSFGVPGQLAGVASIVLPLLEVALAASLLPAASAWAGGVGALALLLVFAGAIVQARARGREPECHCFGRLHSSRAGRGALARDVALAGVAALVVIAGAHGRGPGALAWVGRLSAAEAIALGGGCVLSVVLVFQAWFSLQLLRQNGRLLDRLEAIERRLAGPLHASTPVPVANGDVLSVGRRGDLRSSLRAHRLPVGSPAPNFALPALEGGVRTLDGLRAAGKPVLIVFSDPGCGACGALLPEVARWRREYHAWLSVVLITRRQAEASTASAAEHSLGEVLLEADREVSGAYGADGTPSAVLVSAEGAVASPLARGGEAIRQLVSDALRAASPPSGPAVGSPAPELALPDLDGRTVSIADFRGRRVILVFWDPGCGFCQRALPELRAWESDQPEGAPELLLISTGSVEANRRMGMRSPVLLDEDRSTMRAYGAGGTPMAVVVDEHGQIASGVLSGASSIVAALRGDRQLALGPRRAGFSV